MLIILLDFDGTLAGRNGGNPLVFNESLIAAVNKAVEDDPDTIVIGFTAWISKNFGWPNVTSRDEIIQGLNARDMKLHGMYTTFGPFYMAHEIEKEALPKDNVARQEKCLKLMNTFYDESIAPLDREYVNIPVAKAKKHGTEAQHAKNNINLENNMRMVELRLLLPDNEEVPNTFDEYQKIKKDIDNQANIHKNEIAEHHGFKATSEQSDQNKEEMLRSIMTFFGTDENTFVLFDDKSEVIEEARCLANEGLPIHHYHVTALGRVTETGNVSAKEIADKDYQCYKQTLDEAHDRKSIKDALLKRKGEAEQEKLMQDEAHLKKLKQAVKIAQTRYKDWYDETNQSPWESPIKQSAGNELNPRKQQHQNTPISTFFLHTAKGQKNAENFATRIQEMELDETVNAIQEQLSKGAWNTHSFNSFLADAFIEINCHTNKPHYMSKEYADKSRDNILYNEIKFNNK
jgi:hypothetical protein